MTATSKKIYNNSAHRHDFVLLFDVTDGNPNGDPDTSNLPRIDPETGHGLVTDVALKRKVRDWVALKTEHEKTARQDKLMEEEADAKNRYEIYVQHQGILANQQKRGFEAVANGKPTDRPNNDVRTWMCQTFYDIRMFGAVMTTGKSGQKKGNTELQWNAGQVRGPLQLTFARSEDPIYQLDMAITRVALTNADDTKRGAASDNQDEATSGTFGRKALVPYGLYRAHGFFNPHFAQRTGVTEEDLALFWQALQMMWDMDRSASRGMMACRGLYIFSHESSLGNAPAHELFERIDISLDRDVVAPRSFKQYGITVDDENLPEGVTLTRLIGA